MPPFYNEQFFPPTNQEVIVEPNQLQRPSSLSGTITFLMLAVLTVGNAFAQEVAVRKTAHGTLEVAGKGSPLEYAYAVPQRNDELLVILSDQPLTDKELKDVFERIHRAEAGEIHTVEIILDAKKQPISVSVRHKEFMTRGGGGSTEDRYEQTTSDKNTIAGRVYRNSPGEFDGVKFNYDATFTATIWKEPAPTYSGAAAKNSPQAKAALAFLKAGHTGDVAGVKKLIVASSVADLEGPMGKDIIDMMKLGPDPAKAKITRVDVKGESAEVTIEQGTKESMTTTTIKLTLENGQWKVSP